MDWSKAKNILIIALLLTDLLLAGLYLYQNETHETPRDSEIENTLEVLEKRNIYVDTEIPDRVPKMSVLFVKYVETDEDQVKDVLRRQRGNQEAVLTEEWVKQLCSKVISDCGFAAETLVYDSCRIEGNTAEVIYKNIYQGIPIEESGIRCTVEDGQVTSVERMWLTPVEKGKMKQKVIQPTDALMEFMSEWAKEEDREDNGEVSDEIHIEHIDLVYWLDTSLGPSYGVEDTALPAWRIIYNDGQVTFVDAYDQI